MSSAGSIYVDLLLKDAKYTEGWKRAGRTTKRGAQDIEKDSKQIIQTLAKVGLAAGLTATAFSLQLSKSAIAAADAIGESAKRIGVGTTELQRYSFAAKQSGLDVASLEQGLSFLNKQMANGKVPYTDIAEAIDDIADRASKANSPVERTGILIEAFGKQGAKFVEFTENGSAGLQALGDEAQRLGIVLDESLINTAKDISDSFDQIGDVISSNLQAGILEEFNESYTDLADSFKDPETLEGIRLIGNAVGNLVIIAGKGVRNIVALIAAYKEIAAIASFDIISNSAVQQAQREYEKINQLKAANANILKNGASTGNVGLDLASEFESRFGAKSSSGSGGSYTKFAEQQRQASQANKEREQELERLNQLYERNESVILGVTDSYLNYQERINELQELEAQGLINKTQLATALENLGEAYEESTGDAEEWAFDIEAMGKKAAENVQDAFADFLFDPFAEGTDGMLKGFVDVVRKMIAEATAAQLGKALFGGGGGAGGLGGILGGLGGGQGSLARLFTTGSAGFIGPLPAFAEGGYLGPGEFGIAGEAGAELIYGGKSGVTVTPQDKMGGSTYYIDARGADQAAIARLRAELYARTDSKVFAAQFRENSKRGAFQ